MTCVNYYTNNYAAKMLFCLLEIIKKYIFLCFNVIDLPVLQGIRERVDPQFIYMPVQRPSTYYHCSGILCDQY